MRGEGKLAVAAVIARNLFVTVRFIANFRVVWASDILAKRKNTETMRRVVSSEVDKVNHGIAL